MRQKDLPETIERMIRRADKRTQQDLFRFLQEDDEPQVPLQNLLARILGHRRDLVVREFWYKG